MKKFIADFRKFIAQGNVLDLAVGMIIGAAFTSIVKSLVDDVIMPLIALLTGGMQFTDWKIKLGLGPNASTINIGSFVAAVLNFLIIAFIIFLMIRSLSKLRDIAPVGKKEEDAPTTKICPFCKSEIDINATRCPHCTSELEK